MQTKRRITYVLMLLIAVLLILLSVQLHNGNITPRQSEQNFGELTAEIAAELEKFKPPAKLSSVLYQLYLSENREDFARTRMLTVYNKSVLAEITVDGQNFVLDSKYGEEMLRYTFDSKTLIQAWVKIDKLLEIIL